TNAPKLSMQPAPDKSRVAALLLAAGSSRRFGRGNKLLADVDGRPLIFWSAAAFVSSRASELVVVTGPEPEAIEAALTGLPARFVHNPDHLSGMGGSVAVGIRAFGDDCTGVLICPGDMPGVSTDLINALIAAFEATGSSRIIRPMLPGERPGNPVLWPRRYFPQLARLQGPAGGRTLLAKLEGEIKYLPWHDQGAALDIDTPEDLERYRQAKHQPHSS